MEITKNTLMHLNRTFYFTDDGYCCDSLQEARVDSEDPEGVRTIRKQNCYIRKFNELNDDQKEEVEYIYYRTDWDDIPLEDIISVVSARGGRILLIDDKSHVDYSIKHNIYSIVNKKRN